MCANVAYLYRSIQSQLFRVLFLIDAVSSSHMASHGLSPCRFCRPTSARHRSARCSTSVGEFGPPPPPVPDIDADTAGAYDVADDGKPMWLKYVYSLLCTS
jgi:hypothetical protein